jgi:hypothetical protein
MILLQHHVGRLLESRFVSPMSAEELKDFERQRAALRERTSRERVVVMDFRRAAVLPPELADGLAGLLHGPNPALLRNGVLVSTAVMAMQLQRIVREADNDCRRVFRERRELEAWLGEILDAGERARLKQFLDD